MKKEKQIIFAITLPESQYKHIEHIKNKSEFFSMLLQKYMETNNVRN